MTDPGRCDDSTHTMVMGVFSPSPRTRPRTESLWLDLAKAAQHGRDSDTPARTSSTSAQNPRALAPSACPEADELARITGCRQDIDSRPVPYCPSTPRAHPLAATALSEGAQIINDVSEVARWMPNCRMWSPTRLPVHRAALARLARRSQGREPRSRHLRLRARCIDRRTRRTHAPSRRCAGRRRKA